MRSQLQMVLAAVTMTFAVSSSAAIIYKETPPLAQELEAWKAEMAPASGDDKDRSATTPRPEAAAPLTDGEVRPVPEEERPRDEKVSPTLLRPDEAAEELA